MVESIPTTRSRSLVRVLLADSLTHCRTAVVLAMFTAVLPGLRTAVLLRFALLAADVLFVLLTADVMFFAH